MHKGENVRVHLMLRKLCLMSYLVHIMMRALGSMLNVNSFKVKNRMFHKMMLDPSLENTKKEFFQEKEEYLMQPLSRFQAPYKSKAF